MIISTDAEKSIDKIQHPFMIKTLSKVGLEGTNLNVIKVIYDKPTASITFNGQKLQVFPLRLGTRQGCLLSPLIQHSTQSPRKNKRHPNRKGRSKMLLFVGDMILYIQNPKDSTKKLLELINEFSKEAEYKINI